MSMFSSSRITLYDSSFQLSRYVPDPYQSVNLDASGPKVGLNFHPEPDRLANHMSITSEVRSFPFVKIK